MAVSSTTTQVSVSLTQAQQTIAVPFAFFSPSDLVVLHNGAALTMGTHYVVTGGNGSAGGVALLPAGPSTGTVIVYRLIPNVQPEDFTDGGPLPPSAVERGLDRLCYQVQQIASDIGRVVRVSVADQAQPPLVIGTTGGIVGTSGNGIARMLSTSEAAEILNLSGSVVNRPTKTFADDAARALSVPDFIGQLAVQLDRSGLACLFEATGTVAGSWTNIAINQGGVGGGEIAPDAITRSKILDGEVVAGKLGPSAVGASNIATNAVTRDKIQAGEVVAGKLGPSAVGASNIATDAVTRDKIQAGEVVSGKLGPSAVGEANIATGAVTRDKILDGEVTGNKIEPFTITPGKIANSPYGLAGIRTFTSGTNATFAPSANVRAMLVEMWGGGGGGGGATNPSSSNTSCAGSGGGGGYVRLWITNMAQVFKYTIGGGGAGGTGTTSQAGSSGGASSFVGGVDGTTTLATASGGGGGAGRSGTSSTYEIIGGGGGAAALGSGVGILVTSSFLVPGGSGGTGLKASQASAGDAVFPSIPGTAWSFPAMPAAARDTSTPSASPTATGGRGPNLLTSGTSSANGGQGGGGLLIITEYY